MSLLLIYRNRCYGKPGTATLGLGVNCLNTLRCLKRLGIDANAVAVWDADDINPAILKYSPTVVIIEAPWLSMEEVLTLCTSHQKIHFYIRCHSDLAFLQVEPGAVNLIRETVLYSESILNLSMAGNSKAFCSFIEEVYHGKCFYLPNLYHHERVDHKRVLLPKHLLKSASFGAIRLQKNHISGAAAALILARRLGIDLEFHLVSDGASGGKAEVVQAIQNLFNGVPWAKLIVHPWRPWPIFRRHVAEVDIAFHLSCTETFSLATADCLAESVPVVGSEVIDWLPRSWRANLDDPGEAATVGYHLLHDHRTTAIGHEVLRAICQKNEDVWVKMFQ